MLTISKTDKPSLPLIPEGVHVATCCAVIDLGVQTVEFKDTKKDQRKVLIMWELPDVTYEQDGEDKPRVISKTFTASLDERASLFKTVEAWLGRKLTGEELKKFDLRSLLASPCQIQVVHVKRDTGTYANIQGIMALPARMQVPPPTQAIAYDLDDADALDTLSMLPKWIQERIKESKTYNELAERAEKPLWEDDVPPPDDGDLPF